MTVRQRLQGKFSISADLLQHFAIWRLADEITRSYDRTPLPRVPASELTERAVATLDNYSENLKIANVLGKTYGFRVCAFWQPALIYGRKPLVDYEQEFQRLSSQPEFFFQPLAAVYREAEQRERDGQFIFLGGVFDGVSQAAYLDWVHLNPQGNLLVAQAIAHHLEVCMQAYEKP